MDELPDTVIVFGGGTFGMRLADALDQASVRVAAIVDRLPRPARRPVQTLDELDLNGATVVLGVCNPEADVVAIAGLLMSRGAAGVVSPVSAAVGLHRRGFTFENYWLTGDLSIYGREAEEIAASRRRLEDERSRQIFDSILGYRTSGALADLSKVGASSDLYHPADLAFESRRMRFMDVGAFNGDTIRDLRSRNCDVEAIMAFEPDSVSWAEANDELTRWEAVDGACLEAAVGRTAGEARFADSGEASSNLSETGSSIVRVVSLDSVAGEWRPTHLKMDIEGAEPDALLGAVALLTGSRPRLALSVYHQPSHLWDITNQVDSLDLGYRFWLRCHGQQTFDTVLYCSTEEL